MAVSERKRAANQANAKRSTGPRTRAGKAAASLNALAHGLTARNTLLPSEDRDEYRRFALRVLHELRPDGAFQDELAGEVVNLSWKLRRVPEAESMLMVETHVRGPQEPSPRVICNMILAKKSWDHSPDSPLWLLDRYAARIERARASALRMLLTLQKRRESRDDAVGLEDNGDTAPSGEAVTPGTAGAGTAGRNSHDAPVQNEATAGPGDGDAQVTDSAMYAIIGASSDVDPGATGEATAGA